MDPICAVEIGTGKEVRVQRCPMRYWYSLEKSGKLQVRLNYRGESTTSELSFRSDKLIISTNGNEFICSSLSNAEKPSWLGEAIHQTNAKMDIEENETC